MSNIVIDILTQFKGQKAFNQAQSSTEKLSKSVKSLGKALGIGLSVAAVTAFGKASVKAFADDEAAAAKLAKVVDNLGIGFANTQIAKFIQDLETTSGVLDDELRPAFQALITTTGSLENSQKLLGQAIDISRGSTVDLVTVADDLGKAYVGNTRGLIKYNLGLTKAELATMSFTEIQAKFNEQFKGSNAAYLETYAGKLSVLKVAADNAKEAIGKGIVDALGTLAGDGAITDLATKIEGIATGIADFIRGFAIGLRDLANMPIFKQLIAVVTFIGKKLWQQTGQVFTDAGAAQRLEQEKLQKKQDLLTAKQKAEALAKLEAAAKKRALELAKITKKAAEDKKKADALTKANNLFDMDQIQIIAALKGKVTDEEAKRLQLQLAILTGNSDEASKLAYEVAKAQGLTEELAKYFANFPSAKNPFEMWTSYLDKIEEQVKRIALQNQFPVVTGSTGTGGGTGGGSAVTALPTDNLYQKIINEGIARGETQATINSSLRYTAMGQQAMGQTPIVNVSVTLDGQEITGVVSKTQTNNYLSGKIIALERLQSQFG
jgi:hypothetical protein